MDRASVTQKIKTRAFELGFEKVGVAKAEKLSGKFLEDWLNNGFQGSMSWMERNAEKRIDPDKYLPGVKSIIAVALNYYTEDPPRPDGSVQVSRYAVGRDYHSVLKEKLRSLSEFVLDLIPGTETKVAVDDAPVMDKVWAAKAGIGWIGKHSNLITREMGSYVFIGELLLTTELQYDSEIHDFCGSCTQCIDLCPTQAILDNCVVDSNKCISYRTIEHRGAFPEEWKGEHEDWVFGCDICQEVCPWNKFASLTHVPDFEPRDNVRFPMVDKIIDMSPEEFNEIFKDSPIKRCKHEGLIRNAEHLSVESSSLK